MEIDGLTTINLAILVLGLGKWLTNRVAFLRDFNIPEPVTGGLIASLLVWAVQAVSGRALVFDLAARDFLLLAFFASVGLGSDLRTLLSGGRPLFVLAALSTAFVYVQNLIAAGAGAATGAGAGTGLLGGSVSLAGGHGTVIAMASSFETKLGVAGAAEIGLACATFGLIVSALIGGPLAGWLIARHKLAPARAEQPDIGLSVKPDPGAERMDYMAVLRVCFFVNCSVLLGRLLVEKLEAIKVEIPEFVCAMFAGILITNLLPFFGSKQPVVGSRALALVSEISLGVFLAMSLMGLQLWTILGAAGPILIIIALQTAAAALFAVFVLFPLTGRSYESAVTAAGFCGFALGATPTAMANMAAVTRRFGNAHQAFVLVPIVGGFFLSVVNALIVVQFLGWLSR